MSKRGILVIVSGFSGVGKGTMVKKLISEYEQYALSVSATTREPREGETDKVHYFFKTRDEFEKMISENQLLEYAQYCENYYGTPRAYVEQKLNQGKDVILEIEIQGALKVKEQYPDAYMIYVMPPDVETLFTRLIKRESETEEVIEKRMKRAVEESQGIEAYDSVIVNDDLEASVEKMHEVIQSQHNAVSRNQELIRKIRNELKKFEKGE